MNSGRRAHTRLLTSSVLLASAAGLPMLLVGVLGVPIKADLGIGDGALGAAVACFHAVSALSSLLSGRIVDRIGWLRSAYVVVTGTALVLIGIAVSVRSVATLAGFMLAGGIMFSVAQPATNLALVRGMPAQRLGVVFGIKQASVPLATLFAGLSIPLVATTVGWRWAFVIALAFPVTAGRLARSSRQNGRADPGQRRPDRGRLMVRPLVTLTMAVAVAAAAVNALSVFIVISHVHAGLSEATAGIVVAIGSVLSFGMRIATGWFADRRGTVTFRPVAVMLLVGAVGAALISTQNLGLLVVGTVLAYAVGWGWPGLFHYGVVSYHQQAPASATGVVQVGMGVGSTAGPLIFGALSETRGHPTAWLATSALFLVAGLLMSRGDRKLRGHDSARETAVTAASRATRTGWRPIPSSGGQHADG